MTQLSFQEEEQTEDKPKVKTNVLSVRLSKEEVVERDSLKMTDKEYFHYKMNQQPSTPVVMPNNSPSSSAPVDVAVIKKGLEAEMENKFLKQQIEQLQQQTSQGLQGLGNLVAAEMEKYKHQQEFDKLKEDNAKYKAEIKELEGQLEEAEADRDELFKKVQMIEIAKEVGPHITRALKGFHEKGIGGALGELANSMNGLSEEHAALPSGQENQDKINFANRFLSLFPETEKQQLIMELLAEMSATPWLADKVQEYINALKQKQTA